MINNVILRYLKITLGSFLAALGFALFLIPNQIAPGGLSGLATIIYYLWGIPVGFFTLLLNVPLFILSLRELGSKFIIRTVYGTVLFSFFTDFLFSLFEPMTADSFLATLYGGVILGVGLGIVFRAGASTGGSDLAVLLFNKYFKITTGQAFLLVDTIVIVLAAFVFDLELALYAFLALFISSRLIDVVQESPYLTKAALIISSRPQIIEQKILEELKRGATSFKGKGVYTGAEREVILCVVSRLEVSRLKELVYKIDSSAFIVFIDTREVLGEGFKEYLEEVNS